MSDTEELQEVSDAELENMIDDNSDVSLSPLANDDDDDDSINSADEEPDINIISQIKDKEPYNPQLSTLNSTLLQNNTMSHSDDENEIQPPIIYSESDSDSDSDDEVFDNKFDLERVNDVLINSHPECKQHNYDEIYNLSKVVRDSNGIIIDPLHKTLPILSKYEKTRILGQRAKQINSGNQPFVSIDNHVVDGYLIAVEELKQKKIPFIIRRPLPNGGSEYWRVSDLEILY